MEKEKSLTIPTENQNQISQNDAGITLMFSTVRSPSVGNSPTTSKAATAVKRGAFDGPLGGKHLGEFLPSNQPLTKGQRSKQSQSVSPSPCLPSHDLVQREMSLQSNNEEQDSLAHMHNPKPIEQQKLALISKKSYEQ